MMQKDAESDHNNVDMMLAVQRQYQGSLDQKNKGE